FVVIFPNFQAAPGRRRESDRRERGAASRGVDQSRRRRFFGISLRSSLVLVKRLEGRNDDIRLPLLGLGRGPLLRGRNRSLPLFLLLLSGAVGLNAFLFRGGLVNRLGGLRSGLVVFYGICAVIVRLLFSALGFVGSF